MQLDTGPRNVSGAAGSALNRPAPAEPPVAHHTVGHGDSVPSVAREYGISPKRLIDFNPQVDLVAGLMLGERLAIPAPDLEEPAGIQTFGQPAAKPRTAVDEALAGLYAAQDNYNAAAKVMPPGRTGSIELEGYKNEVTKAQAGVTAAVQAEIDADLDGSARPTGATQDAAAVRDAGARIVARYEGDPAAQATVSAAVEEIAVQREVDDSLAIVTAQTNGKDAGNLLAAQLGRMSPVAQQKLLADPRLVEWLEAPMDGVQSPVTDERQGAAASRSADAFAERLAGVTAHLSPEQAQALVAKVEPTIDRATRISASDQDATGRFNDLSRVAASLGTGAEAQAQIDRLGGYAANMRYFDAYDAGVAGMAESSPALAVSVANHWAAEGKDAGVLVQGLEAGFNRQWNATEGSVEAYSDHYMKFNAAISSGKGLPGYEEARQAYLESKGPEFARKGQKLQGDLEANGRQLTTNLLAVSHLSPELQGDTKLDEAARGVGDSASTTAIMAAAQKDPAQLAGPEGKQLLDFLQGVKSGKEVSETLRGFASYLTGISKAQAIEMAAADGSPAGIAKARAQLGLYADSKYADLLGMDTGVYRQMQDGLDATLKNATSAADVQASVRSSMEYLNSQTPQLLDGGKAGAYWKALNLTAAATLTGGATGKVIDGGGASDWVSFAGEVFGLTKDVAETMAGKLASSTGGRIAEAGVEKFALAFGILSAGMDFTNATIAAFNGDWANAGANATVGAGGLAMLAGAVFPPALIAGGLAIVVGEIWKSENEQAAMKTELGQMSADFLKTLPLSDDARAQLSRRFGDSGEVSAMPVLDAYLSRQGYTPQQKLDWINGMAAAGKLDEVIDKAGQLAEDHGPASQDVASYDTGFLDRIDQELGPLTAGTGAFK